MKAVIATTKSGVFAVDGKLPWRGNFYKNISPSHLKELSSIDMKSFKNITLFSNIVMGNKTWSTLKETPLKNRGKHYILTRNPIESDDKNVIYITAEDFINQKLYKDTYTCLIGGAEVLKILLPYCSSIYLNIFDFDETMEEEHDVLKLDFDVFNAKPSDFAKINPYEIKERLVYKNEYGSLISKEIHFLRKNIPWK